MLHRDLLCAETHDICHVLFDAIYCSVPHCHSVDVIALFSGDED